LSNLGENYYPGVSAQVSAMSCVAMLPGQTSRADTARRDGRAGEWLGAAQVGPVLTPRAALSR
jgi:hypothetical protein